MMQSFLQRPSYTDIVVFRPDKNATICKEFYKNLYWKKEGMIFWWMDVYIIQCNLGMK